MKIDLISKKILSVKALVLDVDGVLTDGGIYLDANGEEIKRFFVQDGLGIKRLQARGIVVAVISGRSSKAVTHRMQELGISHLYQNIETKLDAYQKFKNQLRLEDKEIAYMGDDYPDLPLLLQVGLSIAPENATTEVKRHVHWITNRNGGNGAVREVTDFMLQTLMQSKDITSP